MRYLCVKLFYYGLEEPWSMYIITCVILIHMKLKNGINDIKFCHQIIINEVWSNNDHLFLSLTTSRRSHNRISLIFKSTTKQIEIWNNDIRDKHMYGEMKTLHMFTWRLEELKMQLQLRRVEDQRMILYLLHMRRYPNILDSSLRH